MVTRRLAILGCLLAASAPSGAAAPQPAAVRVYERGARELEFARFGEAILAFEAALALDATESRQPVARPSGMNFEPYLPHLALGVARCESGDLAGAAASWAESDRQAVAATAPSSNRLGARRADCSDRRRAEARDAFLSALAEARPALVAADLREPESSRLRERFATLEASASELAAEAPFATWVERQQTVAAFREELRDAPRERPAMPAGALPAQAAPSAIANSPAGPPGGLAQQEPTKVREPDPAAGAAESPPVELLRAAQELFDGRPDRAYAVLEHFASDRPRARGQAHLLRSSACFHLARVQPEAASTWLARAREERAGARRAAPTLVPDGSFFAPGFIAFFTRGADPEPLPALLAP